MDVVERFVRTRNGFDRHPQGQEFLAEVPFLCMLQWARVGAVQGGIGIFVGEYLDTVDFAHFLHEARQFGQQVPVDHQGVQRVAHADAPGLGVGDDGAGLVEVGAGIDIGVDDAGTGLDHRNAGVVAHEVDQPLRAARNGQVDGAHGLQDLWQPLALRRGQEHGIGIDPVLFEHLVHQAHHDPVGVVRVAAALEHAGVAGFQAQREDVEGHVGARFEDHRDHAHRHAHLAQLQAIVQLSMLQHLADRGGQGGHAAKIVADRPQPVVVEQQAVVLGVVLRHAVEIAAVGCENRVTGLDGAVRQRVEHVADQFVVAAREIA